MKALVAIAKLFISLVGYFLMVFAAMFTAAKIIEKVVSLKIFNKKPKIGKAKSPETEPVSEAGPVAEPA